MSLKPRIIASASVAIALHLSSARAAAPADTVQYLTRVAGFPQTDIAALENGAVIARVVPGSSDSEVMVVAAVKIRVARTDRQLLRPDHFIRRRQGDDGLRALR
jgi:hypothetical protein